MNMRHCIAIGAAMAMAGWSGPAFCAEAADFFQDKTVRIIIGHAAGGDYDMGTRLLARHLSKHTPGAPGFVVQNMPGAGSVIAANHLYDAAPRDGSVFGSFSRNMVVSRVRKLANLRAEVEKFQWLGATSRPGRMCITRPDGPVRSVRDLKTTELVVAGAGQSSIVTIIPTVLNNLMGMKFKVVEGYKGMSDILLALMRDEIQGYCLPADYIRTAHPHLLRENKIRVLFVTEDVRNPHYPDAPSIFELTDDENDHQIMRLLFSGAEYGRPYVYPPGVPEHLVAAMRQAIADAVRDPDLLAEAGKTGLDMTYISPQELEKSTAALMALPAPVLDRAEQLMPVRKH